MTLMLFQVAPMGITGATMMTMTTEGMAGMGTTEEVAMKGMAMEEVVYI